MDKIFPPSINTYFYKEGKVYEVRAISEIGIFSVFV